MEDVAVRCLSRQDKREMRKEVLFCGCRAFGAVLLRVGMLMREMRDAGG